MTDLTSTLQTLLPSAPIQKPYDPSSEFLKEAYRIKTHTQNLRRYLQTMRPKYLSLRDKRGLTDGERDSIDMSSGAVLRELSGSIGRLASAETVRHETAMRVLGRKYGGRMLKWAGGGKSEEQVGEEERTRVLRVVRESVVWLLRRGLEEVVSLQRGMVERRIERGVERERSVLFKAVGGEEVRGVGIGEEEVRAIEEELSPEQLRLFEEENDSMVRYYEDALGQVRNAEKSLLEISSLQQTLVSHLSSQEEYIGQLVTDAASTQTNIGRGNTELKRASERRSTAQAVFWGTVGLCTSLIVWDLIF